MTSQWSALVNETSLYIARVLVLELEVEFTTTIIVSHQGVTSKVLHTL